MVERIPEFDILSSEAAPEVESDVDLGKYLVDPISWQGKPVPERKFIVPGLVPARVATLLSGDGGLGKSMLVGQLQVAATLGGLWLGRKVERIKSVGFYCEDDVDELHRRFAGIARHYNAEFSDLENMQVFAGMRDPLLATIRGDRLRPTSLTEESSSCSVFSSGIGWPRRSRLSDIPLDWDGEKDEG